MVWELSDSAKIVMPGTVQINEPFGILCSNFVVEGAKTPAHRKAVILTWALAQINAAMDGLPDALPVNFSGRSEDCPNEDFRNERRPKSKDAPGDGAGAVWANSSS